MQAYGDVVQAYGDLNKKAAEENTSFWGLLGIWPGEKVQGSQDLLVTCEGHTRKFQHFGQRLNLRVCALANALVQARYVHLTE